MRQTPTTGTRDLGSAPQVSLEKSGLNAGAARAGKSLVATLAVAVARIALLLGFTMTSLVEHPGGFARAPEFASGITASPAATDLIQ
jgi:hypothetical protein